MAIEVPRAVVEFILLGPEDDRRHLQTSPILGDVWVEFAKKPSEELELLITPYKEHRAGTVAHELSECEEIKDGRRLSAGHRRREAVLRACPALHRSHDALVERQAHSGRDPALHQ